MGESSNYHKEIIKESQGIVNIDHSQIQKQSHHSINQSNYTKKTDLTHNKTQMDSKQEVIPELSEENMSQSAQSSYKDRETTKPPKASMMKPVEKPEPKKIEKALPMPPCPGGF